MIYVLYFLLLYWIFSIGVILGFWFCMVDSKQCSSEQFPWLQLIWVPILLALVLLCELFNNE